MVATPMLRHWLLRAVLINKHAVSADWLRALLYDCDRLAVRTTAAAIR
jgi:hypothetical protein